MPEELKPKVCGCAIPELNMETKLCKFCSLPISTVKKDPEHIKNMLITYNEQTGECNVSCNFLNDMVKAYGVIERAKDAIFLWNVQNQGPKPLAQPQKGEVLNFARKIFRG